MTLDYIAETTASFNVTDMDAAIEWYQSVLGFKLLYRLEEIGWCELSTFIPGVIVGLSQNQTVPQGGNAVVVWGVKDIDAAKAHLDANNVRQDGEIQVIPDMVKLITFYDPDGNTMMLSQSLVPIS